MVRSLSAIIVDSDEASRRLIEFVIKKHSVNVNLISSVSTFSEAERLIRRSNPDIIIMEVKDVAQGVEDIKRILTVFPNISIFATCANKDSESILKIMRAGAVEYLLRPLDPLDLEHALIKVARFLVSSDRKPYGEGIVVSVYNYAGGMGATTVAVNLAASLAMGNSKVILVDLNLFCGDVSSFLDINPRYTLSNVTSNIARLDRSFLESVVIKHSSGVYVLSDPQNVEEYFDITSDQIRNVISFLKFLFDYIVIDCGGQFDERILAIFENSEQIFFVFVPSLPSIKNVKRYLEVIKKKGFSKHTKLIMNRYHPKEDIKIEDIERVLEEKIFMTIPNDYPCVISSINKGEPLVKLFPRSPVSKAIMKLAENVKEIRSIERF